MSWLSRLLGSGTKGIGSLAKDIREAIKGKELDPNKKLHIDTTITMQVLFGMLGLVGARSYEKKNNLTK